MPDLGFLRRMSSTRNELLDAVREQSSGLIDRAAAAARPPADMHFWPRSVDKFFVHGIVGSKASDDDMLFFVRLQGYEEGDQPYFVRRWNPKLSITDDSFSDVDWRRTFYLNLIAHTAYTLTVGVSSRQALQNLRKSEGTPLSYVHKITKRVFASPTRTNFQMKSTKASETLCSYPDIYFTVDDFDETFEHLILTDEDQCYCVILQACGGAAFGTTAAEIEVTRSAPNSQLVGGPSSTVTLFSGFVSYDVVRSAYESGRGGGFLNLGGQSERLVMRGPGGRGEVDVIVSRVPGTILKTCHIDADEHLYVLIPAPGSETPIEKADKPQGIGGIMRRAANAAKSAYISASSGGQSDGVIPLRCSLMSVSLPWESLAHDLLFKVALASVALSGCDDVFAGSVANMRKVVMYKVNLNKSCRVQAAA